MFTSSTPTAHRRFAARPSSGALLDALVAVAAFAGSLALLGHGGVGPSRPGSEQLDLVGVVLAACSTVPLVAWRRSPLGVFAVTAAVGVLLAGLGYRMDLLLGPAAALYLLAASRDQATPWARPATATVVGLLVAYVGGAAAAQGAVPASELLHTGLAWAVAWFAGERTRLRREHLAALGERALRVEREAERERLLAAATERARIARDLHDSAGHAISVIAVRAGAARLRHPQDPDRALPALEAIEELARQTAAEIDQMVGTLREGGAANGDLAAPPGLGSLDTLIAHHQAVGLAVTLATVGAPRPLGAAADQAAYRILQEALTNAARHGAGSARIQLAFGDTGSSSASPTPCPPTARHGPAADTGWSACGSAPPCWAAAWTPSAPTACSASAPGSPTEVTARDPGADRRRRRPAARRAGRAAGRRPPDPDHRPGSHRPRSRRADPPARPRCRAHGRAHARPGRDRRHPPAGPGRPRSQGPDPDHLRAGLRLRRLARRRERVLLKRARPEELLAAVHTIAAGEALLSPSVTRRVIDRLAQQPTPELADRARLGG